MKDFLNKNMILWGPSGTGRSYIQYLKNGKLKFPRKVKKKRKKLAELKRKGSIEMEIYLKSRDN